MKLIAIGVCGAIIAGGFYLHGPLADPNVYPLSADDTYTLLKRADVTPSGTGPFGRLDTVVHGRSGKAVIFSASGSHAAFECTASITPVEAQKTRVDASCDGGAPSAGAASDMLMNMTRNAFIELIDSTLQKRAYSADLAQGATAARWPADVIPRDASYGHAVGTALQMDADMHKSIKEAEEEQARERQSAGVSFQPGQPMIATTQP